jgi:hypothetical protein
MFEQEVEMEKRTSSVVPLLLILGLAGVIIGSIGYWVVQARKVLTPQEATTAVTSILEAQGPATLRFHTGLIKSSVNEKPADPHYRLLEKGGYLKTAKGKGEAVQVTLTAKGEQELTAFPEFQKEKQSDGTELLSVPLAKRKLIDTPKVTMSSYSVARVEFTWKWEPTTLGDLFDASGAPMKGFNIWDTQKLIEKYGANFYHGNPTRAAVTLVKNDKGEWKISNQ